MPTYRIDLAYDGTGFHGWARQDNVRTVQGYFETALFHRTGEIKTAVAGRTDAGVHAAGQVVSFTVDEPLDVETLQRSLSRQLAPEIAVFAVSEVPDDFHARFDSRGKRYLYLTATTRFRPPMGRAHMHWVSDPLDLGAMRRAAAAMVLYKSSNLSSSTVARATRTSRSPSAITAIPCASSRCFRKASESSPFNFKHIK